MSTDQSAIKKTKETSFVTISETANNQINEVIKQQNKEVLFLRLFVQAAAGGISFGMALDSRRSDDDHVCFTDGLEVAIDKMSFPYLDGANVDFLENEEKAGFQITSPNSELLAQATAGCGGCTGGAGCC